ncbi:hypothetical protein Angca_003894, partial [Angiostrongylus cantonensis]
MSQKVSVLDLTSPDFDVDAYLSSQLKEKNLDELVKEEEEMVASVRRLDSDVHQLVYENYNKFLTATSTVRKIQDEFNLLDSEMESLSRNMKYISELIGELGSVLGARREGVAQLGSSYKVVKNLQFLFELPSILQICFDEGNYNDVVRLYLLAQKGLSKYADVKNICEIQDKVGQIIFETEKQLIKSIDRCIDDIDGVAGAIGLLIQLGNAPEEVQRLLLKSSELSLQNDLKQLQSDPADVLDLVDKMGCESFIPNLALLATLHERLFPSSSDCLLEMLRRQLALFHDIVSDLFLSSSDPKDCPIVVRALDRYFRKVSTCKQVIHGLDCSTCTITLIRDVSKHEVLISRKYIMEEIKLVMQETRQSLISKNIDLSSLTAKLEQSFVFQVKTALANLLLFIASDVTFSTLSPTEFRTEFAHFVHEEIVIGAFKDFTTVAETYGSSEGETRYASPLIMLLIAFTLHHLANKSSQYLLSLCREQFSLVTASTTERLTGVSEVTALLKSCSQVLLRRFAKFRGLELGEALVKGYEGVCQPAASPDGVRSAVRHTVEEILECDSMLSRLIGGEVGRKESRHRRPLLQPSATDSSRDSLWCERIDFNQQLHFNKASIIGAIVMVLLKSFTESVRLQTYGKFAVQQIQVDCYYLQHELSSLVSNEVIVNSMMDQVLSSALRRCVAPELVHPSHKSSKGRSQKVYRGRLSLGRGGLAAGRCYRRKSRVDHSMNMDDVEDDYWESVYESVILVKNLNHAASPSAFRCLAVIERTSSTSSSSADVTKTNVQESVLSERTENERSKLFHDLGNFLCADRYVSTKLTMANTHGRSDQTFSIGSKKEQHRFGDVLWLILRAYFSGREVSGGQDATFEFDALVFAKREERIVILDKIMHYEAIPVVGGYERLEENYMIHLKSTRKEVSGLLAEFEKYQSLFPHSKAMEEDCCARKGAAFTKSLLDKVTLLITWLNTVDDLASKITQ